LRITKKDGRFEKGINAEGKTTMVIPKNKIIRDKGTLKKPQRYTAHFVSFCEEPGSYKEAMQSKDKDFWFKAMEEEITSLKENDTLALIPKPAKLKLLRGRWVLKIKRTADASFERYKARLVIKGYKQQHGVDFGETLASVCRYESIRL
jgi:hypothetical protein